MMSRTSYISAELETVVIPTYKGTFDILIPRLVLLVSLYGSRNYSRP